MSDERLVSNVLVSLQKHKFPGCSLALEITESEEVDDGGYSQTMLERLRSLDIKIALDDFGTGYSNFNNLKFMPVGILKTEKQFIDDIVVDEYQQFLSYVLVELAHAADMKLIAEGVETPEQMRELMKNGADYFQGYLFAKPLSARDLGEHVYKFKEVDPIFETTHRRLAIDSRNAAFRSFGAGGAALREGESYGGPQDAFSPTEKAADAQLYTDGLTSNLASDHISNLAGDLAGDRTSNLAGDHISNLAGDRINDLAGDLAGDRTNNLADDLTQSDVALSGNEGVYERNE
jgi:hypothetical protein